MQETIKVGTVLMKEGTPLPGNLSFKTEPYSPGWRSMTDSDSDSIDRKTREAGWTFFYLAGALSATVFGGEVQETIDRAVKKILNAPTLEKFNSLEITRVAFKHFLGISYATVSFHMRNMQEGMFLVEALGLRN